MSQFLLNDGRTLDLNDNHHKSESAVILDHGAPGNSSSWRAWLERMARSEMRAIAVSRPGDAVSDRKPGRAVIDVVADLAQILAS